MISGVNCTLKRRRPGLWTVMVQGPNGRGKRTHFCDISTARSENLSGGKSHLTLCNLFRCLSFTLKPCVEPKTDLIFSYEGPHENTTQHLAITSCEISQNCVPFSPTQLIQKLFFFKQRECCSRHLVN